MPRRAVSAWRVGRVARVTWPLGRLRAGTHRISVSASVLGGLDVTRANVVSIARFDFIPLLGRGLRFEVSDSADAVVFWTFRRNELIAGLGRLGWTVGRRRR
jgi:hypothetical protein